METTWLWTDVSSLYGVTASQSYSTWGWKSDIFSVNEEEIKYANDKKRENLKKYFNDRSTLRKALRAWERTTWNKSWDNTTANISALSDAIMKVMINRGKDEKYMMDTYWNNNMLLIDKVKKLENGKYAADIDAFIQWDWTNLSWTISKIFPETVARMTEQEYVKPETSEKNWGWRFVENFMWYMPKVAESANDVWNLIKLKTWAITDENSVMFGNYIYNKYWQNINNVPNDLLDKDYKEFMAMPEEKRKEYMPTWTWALTKWAEWVADVVVTATPWWAALKWLLSASGATPWLNLVNQGLWTVIWWAGRLINYIPWLSNIRDNLQNDKEKEEWDAFIGWLWFAKTIKWWKAVKNVKASDVKAAFKTAKTSWMPAALKELNSKMKWNAIVQLEEQKSNLAQRITQPEETTAAATERWLDIVGKNKDLSKINTIDELSQAIDDEIKTQKWGQTEVAAWEDIKLWSNDLLDTRPSEWWKPITTTPVQNTLKTLIDYYKDVDPRKASKYEDYKAKMDNWTLTLKELLELRRDANSRGQDYYNKKTNLQVDTKAADKFSADMEWFNNVIEWIKWGKDIRATDANLSNLYTIRNAINEIKKSAFKEKWKTSKQSLLWKTMWRMANWLMFWAWDVLKRIYASFMQEAFKIEPKSMSSLEVANQIPKLLKDYKTAVSKLERAKNINEAKTAFDKFANQRWLGNRDSFQQALKEQKSAAKHIMLGQYNDDALKNIKEFIYWKEDK